MTTKTRPAHTESTTSYHEVAIDSTGHENVTNYDYSWQCGLDEIRYEDAKQLPNGRWPWKECSHIRNDFYNPVAGRASWGYEFTDKRSWEIQAALIISNMGKLRCPKRAWDPRVLQGCLDQLDLNSTENVLLYSGILQAVPLVGSAFKLTSILNRAARNLSKSFRKKPFTTVVKSLISADFIDRFVISPTIDDARRFMDATNYVLRVLETAKERNAHQFALSSSLTTIDESDKWTDRRNIGPGPYWKTEGQYRIGTEHKAFMLLEAEYDMRAVDPLKVWSRRVGLTRPLDSVWDLVPFSFVIDYFTRAGDFISHLSDEMSKSDGLKGRITRIVDCWGSVKNFGKWTERGLGATGSYISSWQWPYIKSYHVNEQPLEAVRETSTFSRFRVTPVWQYIAELQRKVDDYLTINLDLSSTRKRTIAELIIQAKL
jgi:hypothetical protein